MNKGNVGYTIILLHLSELLSQTPQANKSRRIDGTRMELRPETSVASNKIRSSDVMLATLKHVLWLSYCNLSRYVIDTHCRVI